jgi:hypothetical protein
VSENWRRRTLPDGRVAEFLGAEWEPDDGTEPPGTIRIRVHYTVGGQASSKVVLLSSADLEARR